MPLGNEGAIKEFSHAIESQMLLLVIIHVIRQYDLRYMINTCNKILYTYNPAAMHSSNSSSPLTRCVYVRSPGGDKRLGLLFKMELAAKDKKHGKWRVSDGNNTMLVLLITYIRLLLDKRLDCQVRFYTRATSTTENKQVPRAKHEPNSNELFEMSDHNILFHNVNNIVLLF